MKFLIFHFACVFVFAIYFGGGVCVRACARVCVCVWECEERRILFVFFFYYYFGTALLYALTHVHDRCWRRSTVPQYIFPPICSFYSFQIFTLWHPSIHPVICNGEWSCLVWILWIILFDREQKKSVPRQTHIILNVGNQTERCPNRTMMMLSPLDANPMKYIYRIALLRYGSAQCATLQTDRPSIALVALQMQKKKVPVVCSMFFIVIFSGCAGFSFKCTMHTGCHLIENGTPNYS